MLNKMKRVAAGLLTAVFLLNISAVPGVNNVTQVEAASLVKKGKVNTKKLNIRVKKSMKSKRITVLHKGDRVKLLSNNSKWVAVEVNGHGWLYTGQIHFCKEWWNCLRYYSN
ncbi:MAG: SH3 domain-containing protein [Anaerobutyricum soehngenii]